MKNNFSYVLIFLLIFSCQKDVNQNDNSKIEENELFQIFSNKFSVGDAVDSLNGVEVFYNGSVGNVEGRNVSTDGYNIGLKYQCVEFVKRYYFEYLNHKMPNSYGHAKDFYNLQVADGKLNTDRNLIQYKNPSIAKPKVDDLLIFDGTIFNKYGHVAIVSAVFDNKIEIIQQNPGPNGKSRIFIDLEKIDNHWKLDDSDVLGWLRKQ